MQLLDCNFYSSVRFYAYGVFHSVANVSADQLGVVK